MEFEEIKETKERINRGDIGVVAGGTGESDVDVGRIVKVIGGAASEASRKGVRMISAVAVPFACSYLLSRIFVAMSNSLSRLKFIKLRRGDTSSGEAWTLMEVIAIPRRTEVM